GERGALPRAARALRCARRRPGRRRACGRGRRAPPLRQLVRGARSRRRAVLSRAQWLALALVAALAAVAVTALLPRGETTRRPADTRIQTRLVPTTHVFGDVVEAQLEVTPDDSHAGDRIRVETRFAPYRVVATRRQRVGSTVRYVFRLECLERACVPRAPERRLVLAPALVHVGGEARTVGWPALTVASRLAASDLARPVFRADDRVHEPARGLLGARALGWPLAGLAAALAMAGLAAVVGTPGVPPSQLALAVRAAEQSLTRDAGERRRALERLAAQLEAEDRLELAREARRIAWSEQPPATGEMRRLLAAARDLGRAA